MVKCISVLVAAGLLGAGAAIAPVLAADDNAALSLRDGFPTYWLQHRIAQDDFLDPISGPGPVSGTPDHWYIPNGARAQQTNRISDLTNPILKPWAIEQI